MKLQHNLGGVENLGPASTEVRPFVEDWETRIFGIHVAMMALSAHLKDALPGYDLSTLQTTFKHDWTWGHLRTGAEAMNPFDYFKYRYYEKWLGGISGWFIANGYLSDTELDARTDAHRQGTASPPPNVTPDVDTQVLRYLREGDSPKRPGPAPQFKAGQRVVVRDVPARDHTRLPGYLRNKSGVISEVYDGSYGYFFATGDGIGDPQPVYCVRFDPREIWGDTAESGNSLYADLFEAYLEGDTHV